MAHIQAFVVITLLIWAAVSVSGTTTELSTTAGDTVNIACLFGEGTVINIYWYYNNGTGRQKLLFLAKGNITLGAEYANRASLQDDNSTLILKDITVADEGTYCCDVDRQDQTPVLNINTKLNVFSLRPDTLPVIKPNCTWVVEFSSCSIHANQSFNLTCTLPNVYPVEETKLIWYQDGQRVSPTDDVTQNDDGTTDISRQIQVSETGNFTCNATYLSVNGKENTTISVEASIKPPEDVPHTPGNNLTKGHIAWITSIVLLVGIFLAAAIILVIYRRWKSRGGGNPPNPQNRNDDLQQVQVTTEVSPLVEIAREAGSTNGNGDGDPPTPRNSNDDSHHDEAADGDAPSSRNRNDDPHQVQGDGDPPTPRNSNDDSHHDEGRQQETVTEPGAGPSAAPNTSRREVTDKEINNLSKMLPDGKYSELFVILGFNYNYISTKKNKSTDSTAASEELLQEWKNKGRFMKELDAALIEADLGGLVPEYKK